MNRGDGQGELGALNLVHRVVVAPIRQLADLVDGDDARVLKLGADTGLLDEPTDGLGVVQLLGVDDPHGQGALEHHVAHSANLGHVPQPEDPQVQVATQHGPFFFSAGVLQQVPKTCCVLF